MLRAEMIGDCWGVTDDEIARRYSCAQIRLAPYSYVAARGRWVAPLLSVGDLVMARRQLLNLRALAEREARAPKE